MIINSYNPNTYKYNNPSFKAVDASKLKKSR